MYYSNNLHIWFVVWSSIQKDTTKPRNYFEVNFTLGFGLRAAPRGSSGQEMSLGGFDSAEYEELADSDAGQDVMGIDFLQWIRAVSMVNFIEEATQWEKVIGGTEADLIAKQTRNDQLALKV